MCSPLAAALPAAFSALEVGASYVAQRQDAKATDAMNKRVAAQNKQAADTAYRHNVAQETTRMMQEEDANALQHQQAALHTRRAIGQAATSASNAGISLEDLEMDYLRQEGDQRNAMRQEMDWKRQQSRANMEMFKANQQDRINSFIPAPVNKPSLVGAVAGLGQAALQGYSGYNAAKKG